ncbi:hypothetical protein GEMRC1_002753 [Eukaryota sp. GEM-RC1]
MLPDDFFENETIEDVIEPSSNASVLSAVLKSAAERRKLFKRTKEKPSDSDDLSVEKEQHKPPESKSLEKR